MLSNSEEKPDDREKQLDTIIAEYYCSAEKGECPDQVHFIARYPDFQQELSEFFADLDMFQHSGRADSEDPALEPTTIDSTSQRKNLAAGAVRYFGVYEVLEELGSGGMGVVYKARHSRLRKLVALKMIRAGEFASDYEVKMFQAEARAAAKLDHPGIVPVHEVGMHAGQHFYSMDYVAGGNLSKLHRGEPVAAGRAAELLRQMAEAIHYAHAKGIVHRDLKPANVLLTTTGISRITDFGLAKRMWSDEDSVAGRVTETGQVLGTAGYMSPEQAEGKTRLVGEPADIYSLGAVLYALLTSRAPFVGESHADTIKQVIEKEPVSPRVLNPSVPRDLETICLKCLNKERHERYGTAQLLADDLSAFLDGRPVAAQPIGYFGRTAKWVRRHRMVSSLLLLTCLSMLMGTAFSVHFGFRADQRAQEAEEARTEATQSLAKRELSDYLNRIALAHIEWQSDDVKGCEELLDACPIHLRGWEWNYLKRVCHSGRITKIDLAATGAARDIFQGNCGIAFSADGSRVFTRFLNSVKAWDTQSGKHIQSLECTNKHFAYDPIQNTVLVDNRIVDGTSFQERLILSSISKSFSRATFSADGALLAVGTSPIMILNPVLGDVLCELPANEGGEIKCLAFSPSNLYLAVAREDVLQVWSVKSRTMVFSEPRGGTHVTFDGSGDWLISDNTYLLSGSDPLVVPGIRIWKIPTFKLVQTITTDSGETRPSRFKVGRVGPNQNEEDIIGPCYGTINIAVCPFSQRLGALSWDSSIRLFDLDHMIKLEQLRINKGYEERFLFNDARAASGSTIRLRSNGVPFFLAFDQFGKRLATVDMRGKLEIWDISHPPEANEYGTVFRYHDLSGLEIQIGDSAVAFANAKYGESPARIRAINVTDGSIIDYPEPVIPHNNRFHLSKDGRVLCFKDAGRLYVRSVAGGKDLLIVDDVNERNHNYRLDDKGQRLAVASDGRIRIMDVLNGLTICEIASTAKRVYSDSESIKFDPTGEKLAIKVDLGASLGVEVWDATTARLIVKVPEGQNLHFLSEKHLITSNNTGLTCWSLPDGKPPVTQYRELNLATKVWTNSCSGGFEMSSDATRIAVRKNETTIVILDNGTGKVMHEVSLQDFRKYHLNDDGSRMIVFKKDGQILLQHIGGDRNALDLGLPGFASAQFSSDGNKVLGVSPDGIVRVLDGTPWEESM